MAAKLLRKENADPAEFLPYTNKCPSWDASGMLAGHLNSSLCVLLSVNHFYDNIFTTRR